MAPSPGRAGPAIKPLQFANPLPMSLMELPASSTSMPTKIVRFWAVMEAPPVRVSVPLMFRMMFAPSDIAHPVPVAVKVVNATAVGWNRPPWPRWRTLWLWIQRE